MKPVASSRGRGVRVVPDPRALDAAAAGECLLQHYIGDPFLIQVGGPHPPCVYISGRGTFLVRTVPRHWGRERPPCYVPACPGGRGFSSTPARRPLIHKRACLARAGNLTSGSTPPSPASTRCAPTSTSRVRPAGADRAPGRASRAPVVRRGAGAAWVRAPPCPRDERCAMRWGRATPSLLAPQGWCASRRGPTAPAPRPLARGGATSATTHSTRGARAPRPAARRSGKAGSGPGAAGATTLLTSPTRQAVTRATAAAAALSARGSSTAQDAAAAAAALRCRPSGACRSCSATWSGRATTGATSGTRCAWQAAAGPMRLHTLLGLQSVRCPDVSGNPLLVCHLPKTQSQPQDQGHRCKDLHCGRAAPRGLHSCICAPPRVLL
jgi:hypothetical protein